MEMCNHHLELLGGNVVTDPLEFLPCYSTKLLSDNAKSVEQSSYPPVLFTPQAVKYLGESFHYGQLFSQCSLGFFCIPDFLRTPALNVKKYSANLDLVRLGELANKFAIVVATSPETVLMDLTNGPRLIYLVGNDNSLYHSYGSVKISSELAASSASYKILVQKLKSGGK